MTEELKIEIARNAAANGRTVCVLLFAACLAVYLKGGFGFLSLAVLSIAPLATSYAADLFIRSTSIKLLITALNIVILFWVAFRIVLA